MKKPRKRLLQNMTESQLSRYYKDLRYKKTRVGKYVKYLLHRKGVEV